MARLTALKQSSGLLYSIIVALLLGAAGFAGTLDGQQAQRYYLFVQILALGIGLLHTWLGPRWAPAAFVTFGRGLAATALILLLGMGVSLIIYYQTDYLSGRWPFVTSLLPFVIPYLVEQAYRYYQRIPPADYTKWYYPVNGNMPDVDLLDLSKILVIQFEFLKKPEDITLTNFKAKAPVAMTLGDLFLVFINDYNERTPTSPIQYTNAAGQPYGWVFSKKSAWWQRRVYLNPALNFDQNQLVDNDTVLAHRSA